MQSTEPNTQPATDIKLSPCPFCGKDDGLYLSQKMALSGNIFDVVICKTCDLHGPKGISRELAAKRWNLRNSTELQIISRLAPWMSAGIDEVCPELRVIFEDGLNLVSNCRCCGRALEGDEVGDPRLTCIECG